MRDGRHVGDAGDFITAGVQCADCGFAARAWALDVHIEVLQTVFQCSLASALGGNLGGERSRLTRTTETGTTRGGPGQRIALTVGDGNDGVIEGSVDVG